MLILPQSQMFREPRLLVPRMQPLGPAKLDYSNPITKGICFCWVPSPSRERDLVKNYVGTKHSSASYAGSDEGLALVCGTGSEIDMDFGTISPVTVDTGNFSVLTRFAIAPSTTERYVLHQRSAVASAYRTFGVKINSGTTSGRVRFLTYDSAESSVDADGAHDGTPATYACIRAADVHSIYKNGALANSASLTARDITDPGNQKVMFGAIQSGGAMPANARIFFGMLWNRALTPAEIASISLDPYQILIPA
jgi:hypothetical protein